MRGRYHRWEKGSLLEIGVGGLKEALGAGPFPHVYTYCALYPLMKQSPASSYTFITGGMAESIPFKTSVGPLSIGAATTAAIARAAMAEARGTPIRVNAIRIKMYIYRHTKPGRTEGSNRSVGIAAVNVVSSHVREQVFTVLTEEEFKNVALSSTAQ